jgi:hypothetical protein
MYIKLALLCYPLYPKPKQDSNRRSPVPDADTIPLSNPSSGSIQNWIKLWHRVNDYAFVTIKSERTWIQRYNVGSPNALSPNNLSPNNFSLNALSPNALSPNALSPNALSPNALSPNTLYPNALSPNDFSPNYGYSPNDPNFVRTLI